MNLTAFGSITSILAITITTFVKILTIFMDIGQALSQFLAILVTLGFAIVGGVVTGVIMHQVKYFTIFYTLRATE